jgi:hypothetical protein
MAAPMVLASLGLHGLFMLVPLGQSKEGAIPPPIQKKTVWPLLEPYQRRPPILRR